MHKVIEHFDNQSKQDEAAEIEAALKIVALAMMAVPTETVPKVRALLVRKRGE